MSWIHAARARLHLLFAKRATEARFAEELGFHIDMETERLVREEHLSHEAARRRAHITFGGVTQHKETLRQGRGIAWADGLSLDVKLALRMLVKHPGLTLVAVLGMSVAVTIGAVAFSVIYTVVDARLPVSDGDRVISIRNIDTHGEREGRRTHLHDLATWRGAVRGIEELGAYRTVDRNLITPEERPQSARIAEMSASGFRIARVAPLMGRYFHDEDERVSAAPVVVVGEDVWRARFAARPDIVGQTVQLGDTRFTIVGVMPKGFAFPVNNSVWTPLRLNPADYVRGRAPSIEVFARMEPGASIADVRRQMEAIGQRLAAAYPETHANTRPRVIPYTHAFIDNAETTWFYDLAQLLITMLLVVIGTNVAILVYARTASRIGEIAIRTALGASRRRVVLQLFTEALAMSAIGAGVGLTGAHFVLEAIGAALERIGGEQLPFWLRFHITPGVVLYAAGLAVLGAVIVGVFPALKATRRHVRSSLQQLSGGTSAMRLGRTWTFMVVAQVTVAVAVLPLAIAGVGAWRRQASIQALAARKQILTATLVLDRREMSGERLTGADSVRDEAEYAARVQNLRAELVRQLEAEPGVTRVALASNAPGDEEILRAEVDGAQASDKQVDGSAPPEGTVVSATKVDPRYFETFDIHVLAGRPFQTSDAAETTKPVIVNRSFVRKLLGGSNPLGRRMREVARREPGKAEATPAPWEEIVGVVPDYPVDSGPSDPKVYRPLRTTDVDAVTLAVRVKGVGAAPFSSRLRDLTVATNPMLRLRDIKTLEQTLYDDSAPMRLFILGMELVTMSTVLLSAAGIYALMAFTITRRRREIGIRAALGAGPRRVLVGVLSRAMGQVLVGILIGIAIAAVFDHALEGGWTGRRGAFVLPGVVVLMAVVGLLAAVGPARRALKIQPTEALKSE